MKHWDRGLWGRNRLPWGRSGINYNGADAFISEWETENGDPASTTIVLPLSANPVNIHVNWGDGSYSHITAYDQADKTHEYATAGTKTIKIIGTLKGWRSHVSARLKLTLISQWGCFEITNTHTFWFCSNLEITATDAPTISTSDLDRTFGGCNLITSIGNVSGYDVSRVTLLTHFLWDCKLFNQDISPLNTVSTTEILRMLYNCDAFRHSLAALDIHLVVDMVDLLDAATGLSTANYDATIIAWQGDAVSTHQNNVSVDFGGSKFTGTTLITSTTTGENIDDLIDATADFDTDPPSVGDIVHNTTDDGTWARVTGVEDANTLSISPSIMANANSYKIYTSAAAKAKAALIIDDGWIIKDNGSAD